VDPEVAVGSTELDVPPGDGDVVEEDVALWVPADCGEVGVQQVAASRPRAALHDQQGTARRKGVHRGGIRRVQRRPLVGVGLRRGTERDGGRRLVVGGGRFTGGRGQRSAALRAEPCVVGVLAPALRAIGHVVDLPVVVSIQLVPVTRKP
jgi:hypothetical protein